MVVPSLIRIAFQALLANKLRTGLTLLGVIIGVTSVMTIISALEGMMGGIEAQLARLGPATFVVVRMGGVITSEKEFREMAKRKPIDITEISDIEEGCDLCEKICPRKFGSAVIKYGNNTLRNVFVLGAAYNMLDIVDIEVGLGRYFGQEEEQARRQVVFIGEQIRKDLFEGVDAIGKTLKLNGIRYEVVGVAKQLGSMFGRNRDNFVSIPISTYQKHFGTRGRQSNFMIKAVSVEKLDEAMDQVRMVLRSRRHVPYNKPDDFSLLTADNILAQLNAFTKIFRLGLVGISSISLLVGGIVVMNIMMVSVSERTREIGIRKALGAKRKHIMLQFLFEALMTTLSGGLIGIVLGYIAAKWLIGLMDMEMSPSAFAVLSGLIISVGIGVIFGIYPAMKAARLDPIKALSYE